MALAHRQRLLMDWGWKFFKGEPPIESHLSKNAIYSGSKAESGRGPARRLYNDFDWESLRLPHDWAVAEEFDPALPDTHHCKPRGIGWYRRAFSLGRDQAGRRAVLLFDGVATQAQVWVNGRPVARNTCGYTPFYADITDCLLYGDEANVVSVRVDATDYEGWWYEGAGIYRHVWLILTDAVSVDTYGVWVNPRRENAELGLWRVPVETTLYNGGADAETVTVVSTIEAPDGRIVAQAESLVDVPAKGNAVSQQSMNVRHPQLWSLEQPQLYTLRTLVLRDRVPVDDQETRFGFRTLRYSAQEGFFLNDQPVKLNGTCNHQDHAGVGVAVPDRIQAYRIQRLQAMGSNAYRCAHNPPAPEMLDACDVLGMLVMDETRWFSSSAEGLAQLEMMVRRDRNHPSVILWSVFNEEPLQGTDAGRRTAETMVARVHALDDSRAVTGAMNHGWLELDVDGVPCSAAAALDVIGINYGLDQYDAVRALFPDKPIVASESAAASTSRGMYSRDGGYIPAYDHKQYDFGSSVRDAVRAADRPDVMGTFLWTGIEYRGEERWPAVHSQSGMLDSCCAPKDNAWLCRALWAPDPAMVHILPHWNWSGREGDRIDVWCYSNCEAVELYFNGQSLGEQAVDPYEPPRWQVPYERGVLHALGKLGGVAVAQDFSETTGGPAAIQLAAGVSLLRADGEDTSPVEVSVVDVDGTSVPTASDLVRFSLEGDGVILGVGNGDAMSHEADVAAPGAVTERHLFNGKCQVIVRAGFTAGELTLIAEADGLAPASLRIPVAAVDRRPYVPEAELVWRLPQWWVSPVTAEPVTPGSFRELAQTMPLRRARLSPETPAITVDGPGYAILGSMTRVPEGGRSGLALAFAGIRGAARVLVAPQVATWPDFERSVTAVKSDPAEAPFTVDLAALSEDVAAVLIVVALQADGPGCGLTGDVRWLPGH